MPKKQRCSYTAQEKLTIIQYAKNNGIRNVARKYNIDHSQISPEEKLKKWIIELRQNAIGVTSTVIKEQMKKILREDFSEIDTKDFKASDMWFRNMDEISVFFDMIGNTTIEVKGSKMAKIRTTGNDKN
ncbi:3482_t:CDS:2, partial [Diversispora eburnea]